MAIRICDICGEPIQSGQRALLGMLVTAVETKSKVSIAVEKPEPDDLVFMNHAHCEGLE